MAAFLVYSVVYMVLGGTNAIPFLGETQTMHGKLGHAAAAALPFLVIGISAALLILVFLPARSRRRLAFPAATVAVLGTWLLAALVQLPLARQGGILAFLAANALILGGAAAHALLAVWCWRSESPA